MNETTQKYKIATHRPPQRADAALFRTYWQRQRCYHRPSRKFMRKLAHDYWLARKAKH